MADHDNGVTRRSLLKLTAAAGVVGSLPLVPQAMSGTEIAGQFGVRPTGASPVHYWSAKEFESHVDSKFTVEAGLGRPLRMKLAAVETFVPHENDRSAGECFALHFHLLEGTAVPQGTYAFEHETLGRAAFLVVPSNKQHPMEYTAVINHRRTI